MSKEHTPASVDAQFGAEYAQSGKSRCRECKELIDNEELRMSVRTQADFGMQDNWLHFHCFWNVAAKNEVICERNIRGIELLSWNSQETIRRKIIESKKKSFVSSAPQIHVKSDEVNLKRKSLDAVVPCNIPEKKGKTDIVSADLQEKLKNQIDTYCRIRKQVSALFPEEVVEFLKINGRFKRKNDRCGDAVDQLTDCIVFGVPARCSKCPKGGGVLFYCPSKHTYKCTGKTVYSTCQHEDRNPPRIELKVPPSINKEYFSFTFPLISILQKRYYSPGLDLEKPQHPSPLIEKFKNRRSLQEYVEKPPIIKNGCTIDGRCEFSKLVHVFIDTDGTVYQAYLCISDITVNINTFYKLQLLKHDKKEEYYLYCSYGRIGTPGLFQPTYFQEDLESAKKEFERIFLEKTRNLWKGRFLKQRGCYDILEMEIVVEDSKKLQSFDVKSSKSKLPMPIKEVIGSIFDIKEMKETLKALNVDMEKMPLGKISKRNITKAMIILNELEIIIKIDATSSAIVEKSNRFYTLIPHASCTEALPLLNNDEIIHKKVELLNDLSQIEIAYSIIHDDNFEDDMEADPIDKYYEKLHCRINILPRETKEFEIIELYLKTNHAPTHTVYSLEIMDVFKVQRDGEESRFKILKNRRLLWHGSRTSNFAGILSNGLKIAPPEAPANGYMFGKGIYFADMVSKSANYCMVSEGEGYLLLCEVSLGEIKRKLNANDRIIKPPIGKSSIKGLGFTIPDNSEHQLIEDGITVPIGKPVKPRKSRHYTLLYNEYIVYDEAQVKMKYLIRAKFTKK